MKIWNASVNSKCFASLSEALSLHPGDQIALAGSGGKTSLLYQIALEQKALNRKVLIYTTTHMEIPQDYPFFSKLASDVFRALDNGIAVIGRPEYQNGLEKFSHPDENVLKGIQPFADIILVEADGSRRLPAKFPSPKEPVIPPECTRILTVTGMSSIGQSFQNAFHRYHLAVQAGLFSANEQELITAKHLMSIQKNAYLLPLRKQFPQTTVTAVWNQADSQEAAQLARQTLLEAGESEFLITCCL